MKENDNLLTGPVVMTGRGVGYFRTEDEEGDYEIEPLNAGTALHGDTVEIAPLGTISPWGKRQAQVVRIVKRAKEKFVGTLRQAKTESYFFLVADDKRMYKDIFIHPSKSSGGKDGDKVQVQILSWKDPLKSPEGEVVKVIGKSGEHNVEMAAIVLEQGFDTDFPKEVEKEAQDWKKRYTEEDKTKNRRDMRDVTTFTIDPVDAKDFDDAISIKKLGSDEWEIGIHIADVSHFVTEGDNLDKEARKRGTSIYLVDRTIPMLPEILSNDLCSLNPNEDKYAFAAVFTINAGGEIKDRWFGKTLIHSDKRFSYEEAQEILDRKEGLLFEELNTLNQIAYELRKEKFRNGAIEFETEEIKFELDDKGRPIKVYKKERKDTHKLVEDFMLLANREVATFMNVRIKDGGNKGVFVYRIHEVPNREKIMNLSIFLKALGYNLEHEDGEITADKLNAIMKDVEGSTAESLVKTAAIRSMSKAVYSTKNIGHFGLAFAYYTHFTSPIRRYPDLMVHRLLGKFLDTGSIKEEDVNVYQAMCEEASDKEVRASEAERSSIKMKQVEFLSGRVGEELNGIISGVSEWGLYVEEEESKADGMVRLKNIQGDFFALDEKNYAVVGKTTGKKYSLGDKVKVKLLSADVERRQLDFLLVE